VGRNGQKNNRKDEETMKKTSNCGLTRRNFVRGSVAVAAGALAMSPMQTLLAADPDPLADKPNIVWIMADDMGWGDVSCYGGRFSTPNIDRIASQGVRFTDAHCETAACTPTRYGALTGRYSWRGDLKRGVLNWESPLLIEKGRMTVASLLRQAGYRTGCVGKWHLGIGESRAGQDWTGDLKPGPLEVGFDYYFGLPGSNHEQPILAENHRLIDPEDAKRVHAWKTDNYTDKELLKSRQREIGPKFCAKAIEFIERNKSKPFFLYHPTCSPHFPITPAKRFRKTKNGRLEDFIAELDWTVGQILEALDRNGLADRTLVIFTTDNGSIDLEIPELRGKKSSPYEGGHRVPFVARWPGHIKPGTVSDQMICLNGLMATAAEMTGQTLPPDAGEDSFSFLPALLGKKLEKPMPYMLNRGNDRMGVRQGPWKLVTPPDFWATQEGVQDLLDGASVIQCC
jgi:arylsulfatase A-like enzyme